MKKSVEKLFEEAECVGLTFVGPYSGVMAKTAYECPTHGITLQTPNKVQQGLGCQKCGRAKQAASRRLDVCDVMSDAEKVSLTYIDGFSASNRVAQYECQHHGRLFMRPAVIRRGCGCKKCASLRSGEKRRKPPKPKTRLSKMPISVLMDRAKAVGLEYADEYKTSNEKARYICPSHGEIFMNPAVVRRGGRCRFCSGNVAKGAIQLAEEAIAVGLEFIGPAVGDSQKTSYRCETHGLLLKRPGEVKSGRGCYSCAKFGFDTNKPSDFYVFSVHRQLDASFVGFGITNDAETRLKAHERTFKKDRADAKLIGLFHFESGRQALDLEGEVKRRFADNILATGLMGFNKEALPISFASDILSMASEWINKTKEG